MRSGHSALLASILFLLVPLGGCKKKIPPDDGHHVDLPSPEVKLQVAGIDPAFASADHEFDADVFGAGFERGAKVVFSGAPAAGVRFVDQNSLRVGVPSMPIGSYDVTVVNPDGTKSTLRNGLTLTAAADTSGCASATIRFDFDSSVLNTPTRGTLDSLGACLRNNTAQVRIEGHCDERGTTDYNLALGQRRADAVQRYLVGLGVPPGRLKTVSYGEERPIDTSGTPAAFAVNRRAELQVRE
jgi:outer membrane protein OmpA-like peptidoglycan-associated protein